MPVYSDPEGPLPTLERLRDHLSFNDPSDTSHDREVLDMLDAAVEVVTADPDFPLVAAALVDGLPHPALRYALMEFVRDIWTGTQTGGAFRGGALPDDPDGGPVLSAGRPVLPPYVRGLLGPYRSQNTGPAFSFPDAPAWPVG